MARPGRIEMAVRAHAWVNQGGLGTPSPPSIEPRPRLEDKLFSYEAAQLLVQRLVPMPRAVYDENDVRAFLAAVVVGRGLRQYEPLRGFATYLWPDGRPVFGPVQAQELGAIQGQAVGAVGSAQLYELATELQCELHLL